MRAGAIVPALFISGESSDQSLDIDKALARSFDLLCRGYGERAASAFPFAKTDRRLPTLEEGENTRLGVPPAVAPGALLEGMILLPWKMRAVARLARR
jgi:hypothetical protein